MTKYCFWAVALVATLGLLGVSLSNTSGALVSDDEAAQLVGGQQMTCSCFSLLYCNIPGVCTTSCYGVNPPGTCTYPNQVSNTTMKCGPGASCNVCYSGLTPCVVTTTTAPGTGRGS